ncbi:hypothetical protein MTR_6g006700 [Medicago truncatula]|uniref:Uncharacterized protein n=1 Tax=Medicago truncatula TaxID=3880 RepID=G7KI73_MEDTR|nr:hypothetical protein MTR_6g006700 [Medicago truncatula]
MVSERRVSKASKFQRAPVFTRPQLAKANGRRATRNGECIYSRENYEKWFILLKALLGSQGAWRILEKHSKKPQDKESFVLKLEGWMEIG